MTELPGAPQPLPTPARPNGPDRVGKTQLLEREETALEPGDHERFAHYVRKDKIMASAVSGKPVVALCGKVWVPGRDPSKYPVCPVCKEIYQALNAGLGGDQDG